MSESMSLMQEHTRVMGILRRRVVHGEDCSEDESAILKNFYRLDIRNSLTKELQDDICHFFPDEAFAAVGEIEDGFAKWRGNGGRIDITDRRQTRPYDLTTG